MSLDEYHQKKLDEFFEVTKLTLDCYKHSWFSYFAVKQSDILRLCQGRLTLQWTPITNTPSRFRSANIRAGIFLLAELKLSPKVFIESLLSGVLQTPEGEFHFRPEKERGYSLYLSPVYPESNSHRVDPKGPRHMELVIQGQTHNGSIRSSGLDSDLPVVRQIFTHPTRSNTSLGILPYAFTGSGNRFSNRQQNFSAVIGHPKRRT